MTLIGSQHYRWYHTWSWPGEVSINGGGYPLSSSIFSRTFQKEKNIPLGYPHWWPRYFFKARTSRSQVMMSKWCPARYQPAWDSLAAVMLLQSCGKSILGHMSKYKKPLDVHHLFFKCPLMSLLKSVHTSCGKPNLDNALENPESTWIPSNKNYAIFASQAHVSLLIYEGHQPTGCSLPMKSSPFFTVVCTIQTAGT